MERPSGRIHIKESVERGIKTHHKMTDPYGHISVWWWLLWMLQKGIPTFSKVFLDLMDWYCIVLLKPHWL